MAESLVYRNALVYEAFMLALYGRHYRARYRVIADLIPSQSTVLDLCCGPGILYERYLRPRDIRYVGLDINSCFIARVNAQGGQGQIWDLNTDRPLPRADVVVMQASLYQFLPDPSPVVRRLLDAASNEVILAEPIHNLSSSRNPLLAMIARHQADAGLGHQPGRFDEQRLDAFIATLGIRRCWSFLIPGGREKVYVLDPRRDLGTRANHASAEHPAVSLR